MGQEIKRELALPGCGLAEKHHGTMLPYSVLPVRCDDLARMVNLGRLQ
jgi:hypothetical protein